MKFEIVNPSDPYTLEAPSLDVAAVACSFLGDGKYGLKALDSDRSNDVPIFLLGGHDEWCLKKFSLNFKDTADHVIYTKREELAKCLDSVRLDSPARSSLNNIKARAQALSNAIRSAAKDVP